MKRTKRKLENTKESQKEENKIQKIEQVIEVKVPENAPIIGKGNLLEEFLFPFSKKDFMNQVWAKKALYTKGGNIKRFKKFIKKFMYDLDIEELLEETASDSIHIWIKNSNTKEINSFQMDDVENVKMLFESGASLYFRAPPDFEEKFVRGMSNALGQDFSAYYTEQNENETMKQRGEIETFLSNKGHITDWHFDFMENFTFQLKGSKKWTLKSSDIFETQRGYTPHYKVHDTKEQQLKLHQLQNPNFNVNTENFVGEEIILEEGNVLYFPSGYWHKVEALEDSISINISLVNMRWSDLIFDGLKTLVYPDNKWRSSILIKSKEDARDYVKKLLEDLQEKIEKVEPEDFLPNSIFIPRKTQFEIEEEEEEDEEDENQVIIRSNSIFRVNPIAVVIKLYDKYVIHINFGGEEFSSTVRVELNIPNQFDSIMKWIQNRKENFSVKDILKISKVNEDQVYKLLKVLNFNGLIHII